MLKESCYFFKAQVFMQNFLIIWAWYIENDFL